MVKKKGAVWNFFTLKGKGVSCKYCFKAYKQSHAHKMANHIKKCFKCPQDLKKVLDLTTNSGKPATSSMKSTWEPLVVGVGGEGDVNKPGPSSSEKSSVDVATSSQSLSSTPKAKFISSFVDQMDIQTNVSNCFIMIT